MMPAMPAAVPPVVMTANAARSPMGPHNPAVRVIVIGIVTAVVVRIIVAAANEEVTMVEVRNAESAAMPTSTAMPTAAAMAATAAADFGGQSFG